MKEGTSMKSKIIDKYIYTGFGFPVELRRVKMVMLRGEWHPKIDVRKIASLTIKELASQEERFTGNQVKFIRSYFSMSLREFATVINESHTAISKWEKAGDKVTNMDINIEKILRLYILEKIDDSIKKEEKFYKNYLNLKKIHPTNKQTSHIKICVVPIPC